LAGPSSTNSIPPSPTRPFESGTIASASGLVQAIPSTTHETFCPPKGRSPFMINAILTSPGLASSSAFRSPCRYPAVLHRVPPLYDWRFHLPSRIPRFQDRFRHRNDTRCPADSGRSRPRSVLASPSASLGVSGSLPSSLFIQNSMQSSTDCTDTFSYPRFQILLGSWSSLKSSPREVIWDSYWISLPESYVHGNHPRLSVGRARIPARLGTSVQCRESRVARGRSLAGPYVVPCYEKVGQGWRWTPKQGKPSAKMKRMPRAALHPFRRRQRDGVSD
jgi:hypothetical protein